ncbi:unnamed protein product [Linum trigynum]|uniref:Uncharacterized protein n=1 Tax=Linum trigynum TaxID=586398 RepID=A0AAV2CM52_9ROSI
MLQSSSALESSTEPILMDVLVRGVVSQRREEDSCRRKKKEEGKKRRNRGGLRAQLGKDEEKMRDCEIAGPY